MNSQICLMFRWSIFLSRMAVRCYFGLPENNLYCGWQAPDVLPRNPHNQARKELATNFLYMISCVLNFRHEIMATQKEIEGARKLNLGGFMANIGFAYCESYNGVAPPQKSLKPMNKPIWPFTRQHVGQVVSKIMKETGIAEGKHRCPKASRYGCGINAATNGVQLHILQKWLGPFRSENNGYLCYCYRSGRTGNCCENVGLRKWLRI